MARSIFVCGSLLFILIFAGLSWHSHRYIVTTSTDAARLTDSIAFGKRVWERNTCINCHTILGEGADFAPEFGNAMTRWGVVDDPELAFETLERWMESMPTCVEAAGRCRSST